MNFYRISLIAIAVTGCSTPPVWPDWVLNPESESGVTAAECVKASGNISLDRTQATAMARSSMARNLEVKVQAMDELYTKKAEAGEESRFGSSFTSTSKLLTEKTIQNSKVSKVEQVVNSSGNWLCAQVVLEERAATGYAREVIDRSGVKASAQTEELLLAQFRQKSGKKSNKGR